MNIHSDYRKLNDYKGASCGQHSALSTQHSALSTQHSARTWLIHACRSLLLLPLIFSSLPVIAQSYVYECLYPQYGRHPDPVTACNLVINAQLNNKEPWYSFDGCRHEVGGVLQYYYSGTGKDRFYVTACNKGTNPDRYTTCDIGREITYTCQYDPPRVENYQKSLLWSLNSWETSSQILTLTPAPNQKAPRPKRTEGKDPKSSTYELIAKVMEGSTPKAGVAVTFGVDVLEKTGGHGHHDANRPKGDVKASSPVTDANGEIKLSFLASIVAGSHNITATCDSCSNKTALKKVDVLVPDLQPISANPPRNPDGTYAYALTSDDPTHVGTSGGRQRGEYYLTQAANDNLRGLIDQFAEEGWGIVALNDASLNWGGVYDIRNNWLNPHMGHRLGEEIDISFVRAGNGIGKSKQNEFYDKFCQDKKGSVPFTILHHYQKQPHFHVYLTGKKQCGKTAD